MISVGTNSTRMLLADVAPDVPYLSAAGSIGTRLGEDLGRAGALAPEPMRRTLDALRQFYRQLRGHYVKLFAVATSAVRRASNGDEFLERAQEIIGVPVRVLSGEEEAEVSYRGAITALRATPDERVAVIDVGGGSTEYAAGVEVKPERVLSLEIGAVRLTEEFPQLAGREGSVTDGVLERAQEKVREVLSPLRDCDQVQRAAFVGGSATTTAAIVRARKGTFETFTLERADLQRVMTRLCAMPLEERKRVVGMRPQRADILPAGILVLDTALELVNLEKAVATTADLLLGVMLQYRDTQLPAGEPEPARAGSRSPKGYG